MANPWDKQPGEPHEQWRAFTVYRDMEKRSLIRLSKALKKGGSTVEKWSQAWDWPKRAEAWDVELDRRAQVLQTDALQDMRRRHINLGVGMQTAGVKELVAWTRKIDAAAEDARKLAKAAGGDPEKAFHEPILNVSELIRLVERGCEIERLNRGQPTTIVGAEDESSAGLDNLTTQELKVLQALKAKMRQ